MAKMDKEDLKHVIKRSRKLFKGEEIPKVHGYEGEVEELVIRQPGEVWTDKDGKEWKQIGVNTKTRTETVMDKIRKLARCCPACNKEVEPTFLNKRMMAIKNMCFDCVQEYEQKLKDDGKYESYEKKIMLENEKKFLLDAKIKMAESKHYIENDPQFLNEDGSLEQWNIPSKEKLMKELNSDIKDVDNRIDTIEEKLKEFANVDF